MPLLALDFGSSSVKAAILNGKKVVGKIVHGHYATHVDGIRAEVNAKSVLRGLEEAIEQLGPGVKKVDHIAIDVMAPSWLAMDKSGQPLTPIVTHQDRRSVKVAHDLEKKVGKARHLKLAGNRPFPGGISSTTAAWFMQNEPGLMRRADLIGHLSTYLHRQLTSERVIDPSNASFTGLYSTLTMDGWNDELLEAAGVDKRLLPRIAAGNEVAGQITASAASRFGLTAGTPMLTGIIDTSSALLLRDAKPGQLLNICGSTDVLALCTDHPKPAADLLTRAVGVGRKWVQVSTIAAAGSALAWINHQLFSELSEDQFHGLMRKWAGKKLDTSVKFDPRLAGERTSMEPVNASLTGLTLATTREEILWAAIDSLARASGQRIDRFHQLGIPIHHDVLLSGGLATHLSKVLHRDWPGKWKFTQVEEATLKGLARLVP